MLKSKKQRKSLKPIPVVIDVNNELTPALVVGRMISNVVLQIGDTRHVLPPTLVYPNDDSNHDDLQVLFNIERIIGTMMNQRRDLIARLKYLNIDRCYNISGKS